MLSAVRTRPLLLSLHLMLPPHRRPGRRAAGLLSLLLAAAFMAAVPAARAAAGGGFDLSARTVVLRDGRHLPLCGLGTWLLSEEETYQAVSAHLRAGGRLIDTAAYYRNEAAVGRAVRDSGVPRTEIFVQTKLFPSSYARADEAITAALRRLGLDYIDLMLLHHPADHELQAYRAMERAVDAGTIRSLGLSNYYLAELAALLPQLRIPPVLVQNEIHPFYQEREVVDYVHSQGMVMQGWYPFGGKGNPAVLGHEVVADLAAAHGVSPAQVVLRWNLQRGVAVIPGSSSPAEIRENLDLFGFELSEQDMARLAALDRGEKFGWY